MNSKQRLRARAVLGLIIIAAACLAVSLYWTQIVKGPTYAAQATKQYTKPTSALFDRGTIYFSPRDGTRNAAATVQSGYVIYMNPVLVAKPVETYEALSHYLTLDRGEFMRKVNLTGDPYEELDRKVDEKAAQSIAGLSLKGIGVAKETWRSYPGSELAAHSIGLVGEGAGGTVEGRYGLESTYETVLKRQSIGSSLSIFAQIFSGLRDSVFGSGEKQQGDLVTTMEPTVGKYLERTLAQTSSAWHPDEIGGIIMDPKTGEIVAMSSLPNFNPNDLSKIKNASIFSNPLVEHVYEMGSIMKPLTVAAGLDSGAISTKFTYDDTGTLTLNGKKISNYDGKARGPGTPLQQILSQSLNIGAATVALKTGAENFGKYLSLFGFGGKTGIDLPNEANGIVGNFSNGREIEIATAAYGQGIAVSPIAMTRALSVLANDGYLSRPHLVREIDYSDGTVSKIVSEKGGRVLKKQTVDDVTRMLVAVVDTALRGGALKMEKYTVAAKTGTAQIPDPANKGYYKDRYLHSFFGYFPAYDPKFIVFLYQVYPRGAQYASETLAEPFSEIAKFLISYYNIPPDR